MASCAACAWFGAARDSRLLRGAPDLASTRHGIDSTPSQPPPGPHASMESIIGVALLVVFIYLAIKVVGFVLKIAFVVAILAVVYWLVAPMAGLPQPWG